MLTEYMLDHTLASRVKSILFIFVVALHLSLTDLKTSGGDVTKSAVTQNSLTTFIYNFSTTTPTSSHKDQTSVKKYAKFIPIFGMT